MGRAIAHVAPPIAPRDQIFIRLVFEDRHSPIIPTLEHRHSRTMRSGHLDHEGALDLTPGLGGLDERHSGRPDFINRPIEGRTRKGARIRPHLIRDVLLECHGFAVAPGVDLRNLSRAPFTQILGEPR